MLNPRFPELSEINIIWDAVGHSNEALFHSDISGLALRSTSSYLTVLGSLRVTDVYIRHGYLVICSDSLLLWCWGTRVSREFVVYFFLCIPYLD